MPYSILPQFPNSISEPLEQKSPKDNRYNCIAWAFGINNLRLWPNNFPFEVWPPNIPNTVTLDAFIKLYELIGYQICNNSLLETSKEKIAIFTLSGRPTHAAKQLSSGLWSSKLGWQNEDSEHTLNAISNGEYGNPTVFMERAISSNTTTPI